MRYVTSGLEGPSHRETATTETHLFAGAKEKAWLDRSEDAGITTLSTSIAWGWFAFFAGLGYPAYIGPIVGTWKILATIAILAPRLPRLKEWAYAGVFFDLTGGAPDRLPAGPDLLEMAR